MDQVAADMVARLREQPVEPYRDGWPVPRVITVLGRRSGEPRPFGVNVTSVEGRLYICSATRDRDWVRNLLAAGACHIERDGGRGENTRRKPILVEGQEGALALSTYLPHVEYRDPLLPFAMDASVEEIERYVHMTAVFRLEVA
jgi:hypothetical protein